jgi:hypothetical protein
MATQLCFLNSFSSPATEFNHKASCNTDCKGPNPLLSICIASEEMSHDITQTMFTQIDDATIEKILTG